MFQTTNQCCCDSPFWAIRCEKAQVSRFEILTWRLGKLWFIGRKTMLYALVKNVQLPTLKLGNSVTGGLVNFQALSVWPSGITNGMLWGQKRLRRKLLFFFSFTCSICQRALPVHWETGLALGYLCCGASTIGSTAAPGVGWLWKCLPLSLCVLIDLATSYFEVFPVRVYALCASFGWHTSNVCIIDVPAVLSQLVWHLETFDVQKVCSRFPGCGTTPYPIPST